MEVKSSKPKKQRKFFHEMPMHKRQKSVASTLSKELRKKLGIRSISVRKGDKVKVVRGDNKGKEGKIVEINYGKQQVFIEKIVRKKSDGTEKAIPFHASNLAVTEVDKSDARRVAKGEQEKKPVAEKREEKQVKGENEKPKEKKVKEDGEKGRKKKPKKA